MSAQRYGHATWGWGEAPSDEAQAPGRPAASARDGVATGIRADELAWIDAHDFTSAGVAATADMAPWRASTDMEVAR